jgi:RimJ/RimL family protein N-acetyltransferase
MNVAALPSSQRTSGTDKSIEETRTRLAGYEDHQEAHGYSKWLVLERDSGVAIGNSGLVVLPEYGWVDLGFRSAQPYWSKDLATEVASAWVGKPPLDWIGTRSKE